MISLEYDIVKLIMIALDKGASDLHLVTGIPPSIRVDGAIQFLDIPPLTGEDTRKLIYPVLSEGRISRFEEDWELNFSYSNPDFGRVRASIYYQKGNVEGAFRIIPLTIKSLQQLGHPPVVANLAMKPNGLVLVTGPTGVGKTTFNSLSSHSDRSTEDGISPFNNLEKAYVNCSIISLLFN